jgi:hypothetical protein
MWSMGLEKSLVFENNLVLQKSLGLKIILVLLIPKKKKKHRRNCVQWLKLDDWIKMLPNLYTPHYVTH